MEAFPGNLPLRLFLLGDRESSGSAVAFCACATVGIASSM
jgi:hypothetical protein